VQKCQVLNSVAGAGGRVDRRISRPADAELKIIRTHRPPTPDPPPPPPQPTPHFISYVTYAGNYALVYMAAHLIYLDGVGIFHSFLFCPHFEL
jgi:hypothetical protein